MDKQMNIAIHETLNRIGMPHNLKGRLYVVSAIDKCAGDRNNLRGIVKGLYVKLAEENGDTPSRVERSIRNAIEVSWSRGNIDVINTIFGYTVSSDKGKPTNSEFIACLTDFMQLHYEEIANGSYSW